MNVNEKISLLLRHADRDDIPKGSFGNEILLNEKGKQNAQSFGAKLAERKINRIFTSPVGRCVQTAEFITKGYGSSIEIIETTALGAPGLHIKDEKIAGEFYLQYGFDEMYKRFMKGEEIPGMTNIDELNYRITNFINENSTENGTTVFITHDMLIAFYHFSINKKVYTKDNWINYMTGLTFKNGIIDER
ncbi:MAG: histidine phosphatase family protein [Bacteroidia bacterium]|nr:histidine phosphatase family protein [Bacteroidia bacterium]